MSQLFSPIKVGNITLKHRVVMAPMTRYRATKSTHVPLSSLVPEYYSQRSTTPGTLLITEGVFIAAKAGGEINLPGIWSEEQIRVWKEVRTTHDSRLPITVLIIDPSKGHECRSRQRFLHLLTTVGQG
jgi:2,4-dienoyl-CoA reductase-like NADH-dependent reductase (Old Yellow Enzyme family)